MVVTSGNEVQAVGYDRKRELKAFDDTKAGVKGLVDSGVTKIPPIFIHPEKVRAGHTSSSGDSKLSVPLIDLKGIHEDAAVRAEIIEKIRDATEKWGFFQIVNHGIPPSVMNKAIEGVRQFHEQDTELKKPLYSRDFMRTVTYASNFDLYYSAAADWQDTFKCYTAPNPPPYEEMPPVCRDIVMEYTSYAMKLGITMYELLSESLGLKPNHFKDMGCAEGLLFLGHYYPSCPEPELTFNTSNHTDVGFLVVLLQDQVGGLQFLHENQWVDVSPTPGALVVNMGELIQLMTNDKYKSINHRVVAKNTGPRISIAAGFHLPPMQAMSSSELYGPIKELLSEGNPPIYKEVTLQDYLVNRPTLRDGSSFLIPFKLHK